MHVTNNLEKLKNYFCTEHEKKIFCTKLCVEGKCFDILYDYDKKLEIDNFVSNFSEYLPYYVYNADTLEWIDTKGDISTKLKEVSKKYWNGPNVPNRDKNVNGIFGEVFLDFYERIVKKAKLACTYASRRDFNSDYENKGYDNVLFRCRYRNSTEPCSICLHISAQTVCHKCLAALPVGNMQRMILKCL